MRRGISSALLRQQKARDELSAILQAQYAEEAQSKFFWRSLFAIVMSGLVYVAIRHLPEGSKIVSRLPSFSEIQEAWVENKNLYQERSKQKPAIRKIASTATKPGIYKIEDYALDSVPSKVRADLERERKVQQSSTVHQYERPSGQELKKVPEPKTAKKSEYRSGESKELSRLDLGPKSIGTLVSDDKYLWLDKIPARYAQDK